VGSGAICAGYRPYGCTGNAVGYVYRISDSLNVEWGVEVGSASQILGIDISGDNFIASGIDQSGTYGLAAYVYNAGYIYDPVFVATDTSIPTKFFGGASSVIHYFAGTSYASGNNQCVLYGVSSYFGKVYSQEFGGAGDDGCTAVKVDSNENLYIVGWTNSIGYGNYDGYVIKTNSDGLLIWEKTFGGAGIDKFEKIIKTSDGRFALGGTSSSVKGSVVFWVMLINTNGDYQAGYHDDVRSTLSDVLEQLVEAAPDLYTYSGTRPYSGSDDDMYCKSVTVVCGFGYYVDPVNGCTQCPAGTYQPGTLQQTCLPCEIGTFSFAGAISCTTCPPGARCLGNSNYELCPPGEYQSNTGQSTCNPCQPGTYATNSGSNTCSSCNAGTYQDENSATTCKACSAGQSSNSNAISCFNCAAGSYSTAGGLCTPCPAGKFSTSEASSSCEDCPIGSSSVQGSTQCTQCNPGTYAPSLATPSCIPCLEGKYQNAVGADTCLDCPIGTATASTGTQTCSACSPGYYAPNEGSTTCIPCEYGKYQPESGKGTCETCPAGKYTGGNAKTDCLTCNAGSWSAAGSNTCTPCELGYHQPDPGMDTCIICSPGTVAGSIGMATCSQCNYGYYQPDSGKTNCLVCDAGKFASSLGSTTCEPCPVGYVSGSGAKTCTACNPGQYQDQTGQSSCKFCIAGEYQPDSGKDSCIQCPIGKFQYYPGSSSCNQCSPGSHQDQLGQTGCKPCEIGYYQDLYEQEFCLPCPKGSVQPSMGFSYCFTCSSGYYQNETAKTQCIPCEVGKYQPDQGKDTCIACPLGKWQDLTGQNYCKVCPMGSIASTEGSTQCTQCPVGYFASDTGLSECTPCPAGTYQPEPGKSSCIQCPFGQYQNETAQTKCNICEPGTFAGFLGTSVCSKCSPGFYQPQQESSSCIPCALHWNQTVEGSTYCLPCPEGLYTIGTGNPECLSCPSGFSFNHAQQICLYKGLFTSIEVFKSTAMYTECFNSNMQAVKPFKLTCRTAYHEYCCTGSTRIPNVSCNTALELLGEGDTLKDKYCSACPLMNQTACPQDGLCWNDTTWNSNTVTPYPQEFSKACLDAVNPYCWPKLIENLQDPECMSFSSLCGAKVVNTTYAPKGDKFVIKFDKDIMKVLPDCKSIFNATTTPEVNTGLISCIRASNTTIEVDISRLARPIFNYTLANGVLRDGCGYTIPDTLQRIYLSNETMKESSLSARYEDKCVNLEINATLVVFLHRMNM